MVVELYRKTATALLGSAKQLEFVGLDWAVDDYECLGEALGYCGGCVAVVAALKSSFDDGTVQKLGRWALRNLALNSPNNEQRLHELDANAVVAASLKLHTMHRERYQEGISGLLVLSTTPRILPGPGHEGMVPSAPDSPPPPPKLPNLHHTLVARTTIESDLNKLGLDSAEWPDLCAQLFARGFDGDTWANVLTKVRADLNLTQG